ncbi:hypothetical protein TVAGG3_0434460, partial [Trichomonas vaginalis G3]|uniref:hypothetical protein n=1 Tax=Trichomonas vaginalis (strain ATCC PRA-98 / G3) TaxID=412133 RepID=UPI0021E58C2A
QQSPQQPQFQQVPPNYYQFPPQGYYLPQGFPNYPPQPMPYCPNPWMFQQAPPQQFQFQYKSKRDQEFEEGLNRLRKDYATAPIERKLLENKSWEEYYKAFCEEYSNRRNSDGCFLYKIHAGNS